MRPCMRLDPCINPIVPVLLTVLSSRSQAQWLPAVLRELHRLPKQRMHAE